MFDQLVESKKNARENKREAGFLITTLFTVVSLFLVTLTYSLFAKDFGTGDEGLELSSLVAPVTEVAKPPQPEAPKPTEKNASIQSDVIVRKEAFESVEQPTKPPVNTGGEKDVQSWQKGAQLGKENLTPSSQSNSPSRYDGNEGKGIALNNTSPEKDVEPPPIVPKSPPKPVVEPKKEKTVIVTGGVVNGKAINLVKPQFSPAARAVRASGLVNVQVLIDEKGNVVSASAVSGHQLLRPEAERAARASKFTPTLLTNQPVKVTGVIVYNFAAQ